MLYSFCVFFVEKKEIYRTERGFNIGFIKKSEIPLHKLQVPTDMIISL